MHDNEITVEIVRRPGAFGEWNDAQMSLFTRAEAGGFVILPKRWVVERTHAWLERERRMVTCITIAPRKTPPPWIGWLSRVAAA